MHQCHLSTRTLAPSARPNATNTELDSHRTVHADFFPAFLDLRGRRVVVVGGGQVAVTKVASLLGAGARVLVVAPRVLPALRHAPVELAETTFRAQHLDGAWLVVAAATREVNRQVREAADRRPIFVNVVDDSAQATLYMAGVIRRGDVTLAVSTRGRAPALAALVRQALDALLPEDIESWSEIARIERLRWRNAGTPFAKRRPLLLQAIERLYRRPRMPDVAPPQRVRP